MMKYLTHILLPTALGTAVYLGWRSTNLLVFDWVAAVGLQDLIIRPSIPLPAWFLYSFPDGCWVYAFTSWMLIIWDEVSLWATLGVFLALAGEIGQAIGLVPGSYDHIDVLFYVGAFILSGVLNGKAKTLTLGFCNPCYGGSRVR